MELNIKKIKYLLVGIQIATGTHLFAQGINFEKNLTWAQIKEKAKTENKYIFVDCYATWCGPCKEMEREVYPIDSIGNFVNNNYEAVKIQMDRTNKDDKQSQSWYADAKHLEKEYHINAYPTYLFFSPDGKLVHRSIGAKDPKLFMGIMRRSLEPAHQYYTLLENYRAGKMLYRQMIYLAELAGSIEDDALAKEISDNYFDNYLLKLDEKQLLTKGNIDSMAFFLDGKHPQLLKLFNAKTAQINSVMGDNSYVQSKIADLIRNEDLDPFLESAKKSLTEPDFKGLKTKITQKYGEYFGQRTSILAKVEWYGEMAQKKKQESYWDQYNSAMFEWVREIRIDTMSAGHYNSINNIAYTNVFLHSDDKGQIKLALAWMKTAVNSIPESPDEISSALDVADLDTYGCLLYKNGQVDEALKFEQKVFKIYSKHKIKAKADYTRLLIEKMQKGEKVWLEKSFISS